MATEATPWLALPGAAVDELKRLDQRWRQLPLDQALGASAGLRSAAERMLAWVGGGDRPRLPDLGPATSFDQLTVAVFEVAQLGDERQVAELARELAQLRHDLAVAAPADSRAQSRWPTAAHAGS